MGNIFRRLDGYKLSALPKFSYCLGKDSIDLCSFFKGVALSNVENFSFSSLILYVICILILLQSGGHHTAEDFAVRGKEPKDEVQIYTWKDATLHELTDLVLSAFPSTQSNIFTLPFFFFLILNY